MCPTRRVLDRTSGCLSCPRGPAIAYAVEIRSTVEVATLGEAAGLLIRAHGRGEVAHTRARDSDGIRPLSRDELLALIEYFARDSG